jgi:predicted RNA-binding Zn-ribbon protein involved in translation (DUF1610 family)
MPSNESYLCPVCGFDGLDEPPRDALGLASFGICPSCGTEFGYDDATRSHAELRTQWKDKGMPWFSRSKAPPAAWDPAEQLRRLKRS